MNVDDKDNAIASAEQAGLYYSSNSESGYTRQTKEEEEKLILGIRDEDIREAELKDIKEER